MKAPGSTWEWHLILANWSVIEDGGIPGVAVKCVDIGRNTNGEGSHLGTLTLRYESVGSKQD